MVEPKEIPIESILIENLIQVLNIRQETFTGEDIKYVVDCIIKLRGLIEPITNDKQQDVSKYTKEQINQWMFGD